MKSIVSLDSLLYVGGKFVSVGVALYLSYRIGLHDHSQAGFLAYLLTLTAVSASVDCGLGMASLTRAATRKYLYLGSIRYVLFAFCWSCIVGHLYLFYSCFNGTFSSIIFTSFEFFGFSALVVFLITGAICQKVIIGAGEVKAQCAFSLASSLLFTASVWAFDLNLLSQVLLFLSFVAASDILCALVLSVRRKASFSGLSTGTRIPEDKFGFDEIKPLVASAAVYGLLQFVGLVAYLNDVALILEAGLSSLAPSYGWMQRVVMTANSTVGMALLAVYPKIINDAISKDYRAEHAFPWHVLARHAFLFACCFAFAFGSLSFLEFFGSVKLPSDGRMLLLAGFSLQFSVSVGTAYFGALIVSSGRRWILLASASVLVLLLASTKDHVLVIDYSYLPLYSASLVLLFSLLPQIYLSLWQRGTANQ